MEHNQPRKSALPAEELAPDPAALTYVERIWWLERERPSRIDIDSRNTREEDSACFRSWALPEYLRK
jgi:hypothetical protein